MANHQQRFNEATEAEIAARHRPDELPPNHHGAPGSAAGDRHAAGAPAGGSAVGGLAGVNVGDGEPENVDIEAAGGGGTFDRDLEIDEESAYAGRSGGAVGGTPANKRVVGGRDRPPASVLQGESAVGRDPNAE